MKHYYTINVAGKNGYSILVCSNEELIDEEVIEKAYNKGLFAGQEEDADYAVVDFLTEKEAGTNFKNHKFIQL